MSGPESKTSYEPTSPGRLRAWEPMTLTYVGHAGEILEGGGGKPSPFPADSGDTFKPSGSAVGGERRFST